VNRPTLHPNARLLTIPQAAAEFGITAGTLRGLIAKGELPSVRDFHEGRYLEPGASSR
jgi:excisionase family DNA binding protein